MKTKVLLLIILLAPVLLSSQPNFDNVEKIIFKATSEKSFEGTILMAEHGEVVFHTSFGFKDDAQTEKINNETKFAIASITKMITAIVILQLEEEDKLSLEDNLDQLLPAVSVPNSDKITVHHLLLHISGLPNEKGLFYQSQKNPIEFVNTVLDESGGIKGFGVYNYANIDYVLLGLIIESIEKRSWQESVIERIIKPVNLSNTGFLERDSYPENFAKTFSFIDGKRIADPSFFVENFYSAACMFSDAKDLLKLDQAMHSDLLLNDVSKKKLYTSYAEYNYTGYSVWTYDYPYTQPTVKIMERRGGIMGGNCAMIRMLDLNRTIIILSNNSNFNPDSFGDTSSLKEALIIELASN